MPNELTGDFDVLVEFAVPTANRVLAAMHRSQRFLHSVSVRVDDRRLPGDNTPLGHTVFKVVDAAGDPVADPSAIPVFARSPDPRVGSSPGRSRSGPLVNLDALTVAGGPIVFSNLHGRAQIQLGPPTVELSSASTSKIVVRQQVIARYLADPGSGNLAEFIRGELALTVGMEQVASQGAGVIATDVKAADVGISFTPTFSSQPLSSQDLAGIQQMIRNALKTSLLPSSAVLPPAIHSLQVKTLAGPPPVIVAALDMARQPPRDSTVGDPATATAVFIRPEDQFALGVGREFVLRTLGPLSQAILSTPIEPIHFDIPLVFTTVHVTYTIEVRGTRIRLETGKIALTIRGHAKSSQLPDFDFTVEQDFSLRIAFGEAVLVVGDVSLSISGTVASIVARPFKSRALASIRAARDVALSRANVFFAVRHLLSADDNLGDLFEALLTPPPNPDGTLPDRALVRGLGYTDVEIRPSGIVLRGSLVLSDWPAPHVEFEQITASGADGGGGPVAGDVVWQGPIHTALKSWIPGGTIDRYEWFLLGQDQPFVDPNRFLFFPPSPGNTGGLGSETPFRPLCLTVRGSRLSPSGPVVLEPVAGTSCHVLSVALLNGGGVPAGAAPPLVTLTRPGRGGLVEIAGHTAARASSGQDVPNRIVHFTDDATSGQLDLLPRAAEAGRPKDTPVLVLAVVRPDRLARIRHTPGIVYLEDRDGVWEGAFKLGQVRRPSTVILTSDGRVAWRKDGPLEAEALAAAARKYLVPGRPIRLRALSLNVGIGRPPPDFVFELVPGRQLTLRKLAGRPVLLVFCDVWSDACLEALRDAETASQQAGSAIVLAIADGDALAAARKGAAGHGLSATLVPDPRRQISSAYGVGVWPTTVTIDAAGRVRTIAPGREPREYGHV